MSSQSAGSSEPEIVAVPGPLKIKQKLAALSNYSRTVHAPSLLVLHCTEGCEGVNQDDNVAAMFAGKLEKPRSAHYIVDTDSCTRCVPDLLTAWHCGREGNARGIGIELCGRANQTRAEWLDAKSLPMLCIAARLCAELCKEYKIPAAVVNEVGLLADDRGITTHASISKAWKQTTHYDPGPHFPLNAFAAAVARARLALGEL